MDWTPPSTIEAVIAHMEGTDESAWLTDVVRSADGSRNCFFGHLFSMGADDREGTRLWDWFESEYSTTYSVYPINDGDHPGYRQETPKQRVLAYLRDLRDGRAKTTMQVMEEDYQASCVPDSIPACWYSERAGAGFELRVHFSGIGLDT